MPPSFSGGISFYIAIRRESNPRPTRTRGERGIRAACGEPANDSAHAGALAGQDGRFPPAPPSNRNATQLHRVAFLFDDRICGSRIRVRYGRRMRVDTEQSLRTVLCLTNPSGLQATRWLLRRSAKGFPPAPPPTSATRRWRTLNSRLTQFFIAILLRSSSDKYPEKISLPK